VFFHAYHWIDEPRENRTLERARGLPAAFAFAVSLISCLLFGLTPAFSAARLDLNRALKQGATRHIIGGHDRLRRALVIAEIALSVVLLISATLLIRSFGALQNVELGFRTRNLLIMETTMPGSELPSQAVGKYKNLLSDLAAIPGVIAVGGVRVPPGRVGTGGRTGCRNLHAL
jgi:putative ABC transport system permease protein